MLGTVSIFHDCQNKVPLTGVLKTITLEAGSLKPRWGRKALGDAGNPWGPFTRCFILALSTLVIPWHFPLCLCVPSVTLRKIQVILDLGSILIQYDLNLIISAKLFSNKFMFRGWVWHEFLETLLNSVQHRYSLSSALERTGKNEQILYCIWALSKETGKVVNILSA